MNQRKFEKDETVLPSTFVRTRKKERNIITTITNWTILAIIYKNHHRFNQLCFYVLFEL